ncbi:hypothetical protein VTO42DRAFT_2939 [Malbranchea cinnamomea]
MRLFLVPISTRRALLYCKKLDAHLTKQKRSLIDRLTHRASETWAKWEEAEKGWKKLLVGYGHQVLQRIPYEEWGLKSVPPLSARREAEELRTHTPVELLYPRNVIPDSIVLGLLRQIATERQNLHRKKMWWSIAITPLTAPIALIPLIPNIPFFYLVYRGWSHWKALSGSKHLQFLLDHKLIKPISLPDLEHIYLKHGKTITEKTSRNFAFRVNAEDEALEEKILVEASDGKQLAKVLDAHELAPEVERAVYQVKHRLEQKKNK